MKRTFVKIVSRAIFASVALTGAALLITAPDKAKANKSKIEIVSDSNQASSVEYIKTSDNVQYFNVKVPNIQNGKFTLTISRENGDILFTEEYNEQGFNRIIRMLPDEKNNQNNYIFKINHGNKNSSEFFVVTTTTRSVDEVIVTKL